MIGILKSRFLQVQEMDINFLIGQDGIVDPNSSSTTLTLLNDTEIKPVFDLLSLASDIEDVDEIAPDWFDSSWFGTFFQNESGWSYHLEFGWIYPSVQNAKIYGFGM